MILTKAFWKRFFISLTIGFLIFLFMASSYIFIPGVFLSLDGKIKDFLFVLRGDEPVSAPIVIVDIDEKSIEDLGQFPWDRKLMSKLIKKINSYKPIVIGLDIVFSEEDKRSPSYFAKTLNIKGKFENYDDIFAKTLEETPSVLGYSFDFELENNNSLFIAQYGIFAHDANKEKNSNAIKAKGALYNIEKFQDVAYSSGFFNASVGYEHIIRKVPLIINYQNSTYSSLSLELYRVLKELKYLKIDYLKDENSQKFNILDLRLQDRVKNPKIKQIIKTDLSGFIHVNFRAKSHSYKYISATEILKNKIKPTQLKDKIVLIGTSAKGLVDLRATPLDGSIPGVEIHANIIDNLLNNDYIYSPMDAMAIELIIILLISILVTTIFSYLSPLRLSFMFVVFFVVLIAIYYQLMFRYYISLDILFALLSFVVSSASALVIGYFLEQKQKELIKAKFASKVSKNVMNDLLKSDAKNLFAGKEKEITIFFSDIRSFASFAEKLKPKVLIELLNSYMSPMTDIITKYHGTIDKFIGDAIMAYWNAPQDIPNHPDYAIECAIEQIKSKKSLNKSLKERFGVEVNFGIGIDTGLSIVGEMGSANRSDYTAIGNHINIASRLESLCPIYGVDIIISSHTKQKTKKEYKFLKIDTIRVKGVSSAIDIYTIIEADNSYMENFNLAFNLYQKGKFKESLAIFDKIDKDVAPKLKSIYIQRCKELIKTPMENFDGVYTYTHK